MMETDGIGRIVNEEVYIMVLCMRGKQLYLARYFISLKRETMYLYINYVLMDYRL